MELPSKPSTTSQRARASNCCMLVLAGHRQHFALWPYALHNAVLLHNSLSVLEDGTSRLVLFSSICVGCNMKHVHTFGCPVLPQWSPWVCLGLDLGPSPMHVRNVYLVLNLITRCVSPQYHCPFDNFFKKTCHGRPDVSGTIC